MTRRFSGRLTTASLLAITVALGLGSRRPWLPSFIKLYLGDVLWAVMFFQLFRLAFPRWSTGRTWLVTLFTTEAIEFAQLLQAPWLVRIRETRLGGLLLGHEFLVSDVICLAVGSCAAALVARWATHPESSVTASSSPLRSRSARRMSRAEIPRGPRLD